MIIVAHAQVGLYQLRNQAPVVAHRAQHGAKFAFADKNRLRHLIVGPHCKPRGGFGPGQGEIGVCHDQHIRCSRQKNADSGQLLDVILPDTHLLMNLLEQIAFEIRTAGDREFIALHTAADQVDLSIARASAKQVVAVESADQRNGREMVKGFEFMIGMLLVQLWKGGHVTIANGSRSVAGPASFSNSTRLRTR